MKRLLVLLLVLLQVAGMFGCKQQNIISQEEFAPFPTADSSVAAPPATDDTPDTNDMVKPPVFLSVVDGKAFVRIADYIPTVKVALAYATTNNFTKKRIYEFTDAYLRFGTVKKLIQVSKELETHGLGLIIWDGFRPVQAQAKLWEIYPNAAYVSHPVSGKRTHSRGNTVDVSLYNLKTGEQVAVPTEYDNFTARADRDYSDCTEEAAANARLLEQIMEKHGFSPYFSEWWHFTDTVDYPVEEYFNPANPTQWTPICDEYISIYDAPYGKGIATIPKGGIATLLDWNNKYIKVRYNNTQGYALTSYMMPCDDSYMSKCLDTVKVTGRYTYNQMVADMNALKRRHPNAVTVSSIGASELGRDIPVLRIGNINAKHHILLQGAIHGREHLTAWLLMALADYWLDHGILSYGNICYHIIPMANPDGVTISQTQTLNDAQREIYLSDKASGFTAQYESVYASTWKANALGVDINRNFPSGWDAIDHRQGPSSELYQGTQPFSSAEAAALRDYTLQYPFGATVNYHATGSIIYYEYGDKQPVNSQSKSLARTISGVSGYNLVGSSGIDGAGYKDWVMDELGIPSVTVEIGAGIAPLTRNETYTTFVRNVNVLPAIARWLLG